MRALSTVPVIASGGAGSLKDFVPAIEAGADAVLAASVFHSGELTIGEVKDELVRAGVEVRSMTDRGNAIVERVDVQRATGSSRRSSSSGTPARC